MSLEMPDVNKIVHPWEKITMGPKSQARLFRDFGDHYCHKFMFDRAAVSYDKSLNEIPDDIKTLFKRSISKRALAERESALEDLYNCAKLKQNQVHVDEAICDNLYDLNRLEDAIVEISNDARKYPRQKSKSFSDRGIVLIENFNDSLGDSLGPFILKHKKLMEYVGELMKQEKIIDNRPLWKRLRDAQLCDVQSIPDEEEILLSPREMARREQCYRVALQTYLNKSWVDVLFLRNLKRNENFLLEETKYSTPALKKILCKGNEIIMTFLKNLQVRSPLYNEYKRKCPNIKKCEANREVHLNIVQWQTRRSMFLILRCCRQLRSEKKIEKLADFVEKAMGDYVVLKPFRVMPWKFEFINEVYNILGLAFTDEYYIPKLGADVPIQKRLHMLLQLPINKDKGFPTFVFGDRSTYLDPEATDVKFERSKAFLERIKYRLNFVQYPIEKIYLYHEIARNHMKMNRFDEAVPVAKKAFAVGKECNSYLWQFLTAMIIVKCRAALYKLEYLKEAILEAIVYANHLNSPILNEFVQECLAYCEIMAYARKAERKRAAKMSRIKKSMTSLMDDYDDDAIGSISSNISTYTVI